MPIKRAYKRSVTVRKNRRFTPDQIREIRKLEKLYSCAEIARDCNVSEPLIWAIAHKHIYKDVIDDEENNDGNFE